MMNSTNRQLFGNSEQLEFGKLRIVSLILMTKNDNKNVDCLTN